MIRVIRESMPRARKDHVCIASIFLLDTWGSCHFTFSEMRQVVKAKRNGYRIKKGDKYIRQVNVYDGEIYTFKAIPEIHDICLDNDLYPET